MTDFCAHIITAEAIRTILTTFMPHIVTTEWSLAWWLSPLFFTASHLHTIQCNLATLRPVLKTPLYNLRSISNQFHLSLGRGDLCCIVRFHQSKKFAIGLQNYSAHVCSQLVLAMVIWGHSCNHNSGLYIPHWEKILFLGNQRHEGFTPMASNDSLH